MRVIFRIWGNESQPGLQLVEKLDTPLVSMLRMLFNGYGQIRNLPLTICYNLIHTGYYTVARRYEFYFRVAKQYFTHSLRSFVKYCFSPEKIKFISSSRRVMFFLLYRQKDIDKIIEGNDRNYVIDNLTREIMENKPLGSRM